MARYRGPTCKLARREGADLSLKSPARAIDSKCKFGKKVNVPSYAVRPGDEVALTERARAQLRVQEAMTLAEGMDLRPGWVEVDAKKFAGVFKALPDRGDLPSDINENLIVELYSK